MAQNSWAQTFNRTMLELKSGTIADYRIQSNAFNRTMLELKLRTSPAQFSMAETF